MLPAFTKKNKGKEVIAFGRVIETELEGSPITEYGTAEPSTSASEASSLDKGDSVYVWTANKVNRVKNPKKYLGEDEKFIIPLPFWKTNYKEIVSLLPNRTFLLFAEAFELVEMFETKTADMKLSFLGTVGNPKEMAAACYQDLLTVHRRLKQCKGLALAQRGLKH